MSFDKQDVRTSIPNEKTKNIKNAESTKDYLQEYSYEDALNLIGFGRVQLEILLVGGIILMAVINETMGMNIITIASQCDFSANSQEKAIMSAACFTGILVASYPWGYLSDTSGRRKVILYTTVAGIMFSITSMFVSNLWAFVALRFLTGIGIAGPSSTIYAYLGEFNTLKYRPVAVNYMSMFVGVSTLYCPAVAWLVLSQTWSLSIFGILDFRPWRLLIFFNLLPGLIGALCLWRLPETPKICLSHGKNDKALKILHWIYERNTGKPSKEFQVQQLRSESDKEFLQMLSLKKTFCEMTTSMWKQTLPLFMRPHVGNFMVCCFVMFGLFFTSSGMGLWYPEIVNRVGHETSGIQRTICEVIELIPNVTSLDSSTLETVCSDDIATKTYIDNIILGGSYLVAYGILGIVINPFGRKRILAGSLILSGICGLSLHWISQPGAIMITFCGFLMLPGLSVSVLSGSVVELIPTHLRGKAVCICLMLGRFGSVVGSNLIGATLEVQCQITFYIFSGVIALCGFLTLTLPI